MKSNNNNNNNINRKIRRQLWQGIGAYPYTWRRHLHLYSLETKGLWIKRSARSPSLLPFHLSPSAKFASLKVIVYRGYGMAYFRWKVNISFKKTLTCCWKTVALNIMHCVFTVTIKVGGELVQDRGRQTLLKAYNLCWLQGQRAQENKQIEFNLRTMVTWFSQRHCGGGWCDVTAYWVRVLDRTGRHERRLITESVHRVKGPRQRCASHFRENPSTRTKIHEMI